MSGPRYAVLISGQGRNLQAILDASRDGRIPGVPACVLSNRADAAGLQKAAAAGVATETVPHAEFADRDAFEAAMTGVLERHGVEYIALAGFMRVLGEAFTRRWRYRMLNIHPSLLPRHRGLHTHRRVLQAGDSEHGASVHFVTHELDGGPVVVQGRFSVNAQDDEQSLAERVMTQIEVKILPQSVAWLTAGRLLMDASGVKFDGRPLPSPLTLDDLDPGFR